MRWKSNRSIDRSKFFGSEDFAALALSQASDVVLATHSTTKQLLLRIWKACVVGVGPRSLESGSLPHLARILYCDSVAERKASARLSF